MLLNNYDPEGKLVGAVLGHEDCPKCGMLMESVESRWKNYRSSS
jgi:hypothetical protein